MENISQENPVTQLVFEVGIKIVVDLLISGEHSYYRNLQRKIKRNVQRRTGMKICLPVFAEQTSFAKLKIYQHFSMKDNTQVREKQKNCLKNFGSQIWLILPDSVIPNILFEISFGSLSWKILTVVISWGNLWSLLLFHLWFHTIRFYLLIDHDQVLL